MNADPFTGKTRGQYSLSEINSLSREEFVRVVGPIFEHSPWIAEAASAARPFEDLDHMHRALCQTVENADPEQKLALIRAHPDLVGRAALTGSLTSQSSSEQKQAGLTSLTAEEIQQFQRFNAHYREKFGFPFVICARLNKKAAILDGFARRVQNSREQEIKTALEEISKIAYLRLKDIVCG